MQNKLNKKERKFTVTTIILAISFCAIIFLFAYFAELKHKKTHIGNAIWKIWHCNGCSIEQIKTLNNNQKWTHKQTNHHTEHLSIITKFYTLLLVISKCVNILVLSILPTEFEYAFFLKCCWSTKLLGILEKIIFV